VCFCARGLLGVGGSVGRAVGDWLRSLTGVVMGGCAVGMGVGGIVGGCVEGDCGASIAPAIMICGTDGCGVVFCGLLTLAVEGGRAQRRDVGGVDGGSGVGGADGGGTGGRGRHCWWVRLCD